MARFKNMGQPDYEKLVGFAERTETQTLSPSELDRQQLYLGPMASHSNGLSDLASAVLPETIPELGAPIGEGGGSQSIFNSESLASTHKRVAKANSSGKTRLGKRAGSNDSKGNKKEGAKVDVSQNDLDDNLDTSGWSTDKLPRKVR
jgi:hypothetical protein